MAAKPNEPPMQTPAQMDRVLELSIASHATIRMVLKDAVPELKSIAA